MSKVLDRPPELSVIMCVYNGEAYLEEAIRSVLGQTYSSFEFVIVDDGSADRTAKILQSIKDPRIKLIRNADNLGLIRSLNIGINAAEGAFIARMDADDVCAPDRFERQLDFLKQNPKVGMCGSWLAFIGEKAAYTYPQSHEEIKLTLMEQNPLAHPSVMFRKEVLKANGLFYDADFPGAEDYEMWSRMVFLTELANIPEPLLFYRRHEQQVTSKKMDLVTASSRKIKLRLLTCLGIYPNERESMVHAFLFNNEFPQLRNEDILEEADAWLYRLFLANREKRQFDEKGLVAGWKRKLLITCIDRYSLGKWRALQRTHCFRICGISGREKVVLLLKCLLKRKVGL